MKYYTGIGSRSTPLDTRRLMTEISMYFQINGYTLRTGSNSVADKAFELGAGTLKEIYVPWNGWEERRGISTVNDSSLTLARRIWIHRQKFGISILDDPSYDSTWEKLHEGTKILLAKTMCMIAGKDLNTQSNALICWTPSCKLIGISAHPITLALISRIPVFNLADKETEIILRNMLKEHIDPAIVIKNRKEKLNKGIEIFGTSLNSLMISYTLS